MFQPIVSEIRSKAKACVRKAVKVKSLSHPANAAIVSDISIPSTDGWMWALRQARVEVKRLFYDYIFKIDIVNINDHLRVLLLRKFHHCFLYKDFRLCGVVVQGHAFVGPENQLSRRIIFTWSCLNSQVYVDGVQLEWTYMYLNCFIH